VSQGQSLGQVFGDHVIPSSLPKFLFQLGWLWCCVCFGVM
jgi:hypothetical protein